jgi:hypothetical protein
MPRPRRRPANPDQLGLGFQGEGFEGSLETRGVFSLAYLSRHLSIAPEFASEQDCGPAFREIGEIWRRHLTALGRQNEAFTCSTFLEPALDRLGWRRIPQQSMPNLATRKRPDYCLFTSDNDFTAASEADANTLFRLSATALEAKKYGHPLDQLSDRETPGWFPSQQVQDYLNHAKDAAGTRFFNWAILTNGSEWRLYTDRSAVGAYFAFHLVRNDQFCSLAEWVADWMFSNSGRREPNMPVVRNAGLYLTAGVTWSLHANHVPAKCRYQEPCIFDASSSRLTPIISSLSAQAFVALANSDVFSFFLKKFIKHNQDIEINDMRMMPVVIPTRPQHARLQELAKLCIEAKRAEFSNTPPPNPLVARTREIAQELRGHAPAYLQPSAQQLLLEAPRDCLAVLENAVNWDAEKLYGVEGLGPFDEF